MSKSRAAELAFEKVKESNFIFTNRRLEVSKASIFWTNFEGRKNSYNSTERNFNMALTPEIADTLKSMGCTIRTVSLDNIIGEDGQPYVMPFVNVKVSYNGPNPPEVKLFTTSRGRKCENNLTVETRVDPATGQSELIDTVRMLDNTNIVRWDVVVHAYVREKPAKGANGKVVLDEYGNPVMVKTATLYLNVLYSEQGRKRFDGYYEDHYQDDPLEIEEAEKHTALSDEALNELEMAEALNAAK